MNKLASEIKLIRKKLGDYTTEKLPEYWLKTGSRRLNSALGSEEFGIPYGKIIEVSGDLSNGKTALALEIAKLAQNDGALVIWNDLERSFDPTWASKRGLNVDEMIVLKPRILEGKKSKKQGTEARLETAEEQCAKIEKIINVSHMDRILVVVDSITAMLTEKEAEGGVEDQNMNTTTALSRFLSQLMRRWVAVAATRNVMMVFINQIRMKPGVMFGDPETTTGGKSVPFYSSCRIRMRRAGGGKIKQGPRLIGIKGTITNTKNKMGNGSVEGIQIGFKLIFNKGFKFMDVAKVKRKDED